MPKKVPKIGNATNVHDDDEKKGHRKKKSKAPVVFDQSDLSKLIPNGVRMWCLRENLYRRVEILDNRRKDTDNVRFLHPEPAGQLARTHAHS